MTWPEVAASAISVLGIVAIGGLIAYLLKPRS